MGAGDWVTGGLRRAVSGVKSAMPGQAEDDATEEAGAVLVAAPDPAGQTAPAAKAAPAKKPAAKKAPVVKTPAPKTPAAKAPAPEAAAKKPAVAKSEKEPEATAPVTTVSPKAPTAKAPTAKAPRKQAPAKAATRAPAPAASDVPAAGEPAPAVPAPGQVPTWTDTELDGFRAALETDIRRLREELNMGAADMADLLADSSDGAGDDQADAGSKTLEREQEMSVNANARDLLDQSTHALRRLEAGTYGICESCGTVIPAARLRAFPRATLCIACKQAEERR
jgi:RNA polymerase-binding transcription factor